MGLPQIMINFKTAGGTAVRRSARGQAVLLLAGEESGSVCFLLPEQAERAGLSERAARLVKLCFLGNPARVWLAYFLHPNLFQVHIHHCHHNIHRVYQIPLY